VLSEEVKGMNPWTLYCSDALGGITHFGLQQRGGFEELKATVTWDRVHTLAITHMLLVPEHKLLVSLAFDCTCVVIERSRGSVVNTIGALNPTLRFTGIAWSTLGHQLLLTDHLGGLTIWSLYDKRVVAHHKLASPLDPESVEVASEGRAMRQAAKELSATATLVWVGPRTLACVMPQTWRVQQLLVVDYQPPVEYLGHSAAVVGLATILPGTAPPVHAANEQGGDDREIMLISASVDFSVRVWDSLTLTERFGLVNNAMTGKFEPSCMLSLPRINQLVVGDQTGTVAFVHPDRGKRAFSLTPSPINHYHRFIQLLSCVFSVVVFICRRLFASYSGLLARRSGHTNTVTGASFVRARSQYRSEEFLVTSSFDGSLGLWMLYKGTHFDPHIYTRIENAHGYGWGEAKNKNEMPCEVLCVAFHVPSQLIVSGGNDGMARCWCSLDRSARYLLRGHSSAVTCCSTDEASALVFTGSEDTCVIAWNLGSSRVHEGRLETLGPLYALKGHTGAIRCLMHLPSFEEAGGRIFLASASEDAVVKVWACRSNLVDEAAGGSAAADETKDSGGGEDGESKEEPLGRHVFDVTVCTEENPPSCLGYIPPQSGPASNILVGTISGSIIKVQLPLKIFDRQ
jgi:WD40 repeat protein